MKRIIPDAYTEYEDGHLGVVPASLANVEAKIGAAKGGIPGKVYTLAGPEAKKMATTIFKSGPLLQALEEAFDAGSTRIHAVRIGSPVQATLNLGDIMDTEVVKLKGDFGSSGNSHYVNVSHAFKNIETGFAQLMDGDPIKVQFLDDGFELVREIELSEEVLSAVGVGVQQFPIGDEGRSGFWVLGTGAEGTTLWHYDEDGELIGGDTIILAASIPLGDTPTGIAMAPMYPGDGIFITTDKHLLNFLLPEPGVAVLVDSLDYGTLDGNPQDVSAATVYFDIAAVMQGDEHTPLYLLLERTQKKIYLVSAPSGEPHELMGTVDVGTWVLDDLAEGLTYDIATGDLFLGIHAVVDPLDRVVCLRLNLEADPEPTVVFVDAWTVESSLKSLSQHIAAVDCTTTVKIQDRNETPYLERSYQATGGFNEVTAAVVDGINAGGVYSAELLEDEYQILAPSREEGGPPDPTLFVAFTGGEDGGALTNGDYLGGLEATVSKTDTNWIHAVGATSNALWTAILLHCVEMYEQHHAERFAILETPSFSSEQAEGSAGYLADLQTYVETIVEMAEKVGDRNAVIFAGGGQFLGSDGYAYDRSATAACGGTMAGLEVQKSLINKPVRNVQKLVPEFSVGHIQTLIQARINCIRFKPGRGYIIAHSLTAAPIGSDYSRVNDLRAVYSGAKAAREAAQPYVGEENDSAGEGLRRLESAMSRPLEIMRDGGQIDEFELTAVSTPADRLLGDVYVSLGIQPRRAMEMIYATVYLR